MMPTRFAMFLHGDPIDLTDFDIVNEDEFFKRIQEMKPPGDMVEGANFCKFIINDKCVGLMLDGDPVRFFVKKYIH